jgi:hypothetical protein
MAVHPYDPTTHVGAHGRAPLAWAQGIAPLNPYFLQAVNALCS